MPPIRAACYVRVSTERQGAEGESLEMQEARAREVCESHGWQFTEVYLDVMSGKRDARPALARLEKALKAGEIDAIICYKVDRLGRTRRKLYELLELIQQRGIRLVSLTQQIDTTTASGRLMLSVLIDFAVYEVEQSGERISDTLLHIAKQGRHPTGNAPFGYRYEPIRRELDAEGREVRSGGRLVIEETEAEVVRAAFDAYRQLGSLAGTAAALNRAGHRTRQGKLWSPDVVRMLITNPAYGAERALRRWKARGGKAVSSAATLRAMPNWELVPADHEPIVPREVAREVRERYWDSRIVPPPTRNADSPWVGLVICRACGEKLRRTHPSTSGPRFRCHTRTYGDCPMRSVPEAWLNHEVITALSRVLDDARAVPKALEGREASLPPALTPAPTRERVLGALRRKLERLELRFDNEIIDGDTYLRERKAILAEIDAAQADARKPAASPRVELPESLDEVWGALLESPEGVMIARRMIQALISRVMVDGELGVVELHAVDGLELPERIEVARWPLYAKHHLMRGWSKVAPACVDCGTTDRRHWASGRCRPCYTRERRERGLDG